MALWAGLDLGHVVGRALGWAVAPAFALTSRARGARTFHPRGLLFVGEVLPAGGAPTALGESLRGPALVRFSNALWKGGWEHLDVLGLALRLRRDPAPSVAPAEGDQDLLFATIRRPWTMGLAPFTTRLHDFLDNRYFAVSPFDAPGFGRCYLRLSPLRAAPAPGGDRPSRLRAAVARGDVRLLIEVRRSWRTRWEPVATLHVRAAVELDQEALAFWPFRNGRGVVPRGLVHGLRRGVYSLSQRARPRG
jgi:hypothetical protein